MNESERSRCRKIGRDYYASSGGAYALICVLNYITQYRAYFMDTRTYISHSSLRVYISKLILYATYVFFFSRSEIIVAASKKDNATTRAEVRLSIYKPIYIPVLRDILIRD